MRVHELIIYKNLEQEQILNDMTFLMENYNNEYYNEEDLKSLLFGKSLARLPDLSPGKR